MNDINKIELIESIKNDIQILDKIKKIYYCYLNENKNFVNNEEILLFDLNKIELLESIKDDIQILDNIRKIFDFRLNKYLINNKNNMILSDFTINFDMNMKIYYLFELRNDIRSKIRQKLFDCTISYNIIMKIYELIK